MKKHLWIKWKGLFYYLQNFPSPVWVWRDAYGQIVVLIFGLIIMNRREDT